MSAPDLFIFAGEASGDFLGASLISELKGLVLTGVGGPKMREKGLNCLLPMEEFQVMGFTDVFWALPRLWKHFYSIRDYILNTNPKGVVLIDYPGFNLRLATALRKKGYKGKLIHYVCPSVWAWGKGRIKTIAQNYDLLLTLFPFEEKFFSNTHLSVCHVGHPLTDTIAKYPYASNWKEHCQIPSEATLLGIFPGSREGEIQRNLPTLLDAACIIQKQVPGLHVGISVSQDKYRDFISKSLPKNLPVSCVPTHFNYELMKSSHSVIAKSGTVNLELSLHHTPTVVIYKLSKLNYLIAKYLLRLSLPHYCIVNIIASKEVYPELIATELDPQKIATLWSSTCSTPEGRKRCIDSCKKVEGMLAQEKPNERAAKAILKLIS